MTSLRVPDDHNKEALGGTLLHDNKSGHCKLSHMALPFYPIVGGARSSQEILAMQPSDIDKKREAFLEYLKQKYPHHASVIMGHQERLREQVRGQNKHTYTHHPTAYFFSCIMAVY